MPKLYLYYQKLIYKNQTTENQYYIFIITIHEKTTCKKWFSLLYVYDILVFEKDTSPSETTPEC